MADDPTVPSRCRDKKDGSKVDICIGEKDEDPVFAISDLLIHLSRAQLEKPAAKVIEGESLDLLIGSIPQNPVEEDANKEPIKHAILDLLKAQYGIDEEDFLSAELEIVPVGKARDLGFDRSMILSYGQDDRICAFTSLFAMLGLTETPSRTACCILVDKEEIGSMGASGMQSRFFEDMTAEVLALCGYESLLSLRRCLQNSKMLSSDVSAGFDPMFADVFEAKTVLIWGKVWSSISTQVLAARAAPMMPMLNTWPRFVALWTIITFPSKWLNSAR